MIKVRIVKPNAELVIKEEYHNRQMAYYHYGDTAEVNLDDFYKWIRLEYNSNATIDIIQVPQLFGQFLEAKRMQ